MKKSISISKFKLIIEVTKLRDRIMDTNIPNKYEYPSDAVILQMTWAELRKSLSLYRFMLTHWAKNPVCESFK